MNIQPNNAEMRRVLQRLRPPSARPMILRYGFSLTTNFNPGYTLELAADEAAISPGSGTVKAIGQAVPAWSHSAGDALSRGVPWQVVISHGFGLDTVVHGLSSVDVKVGQPVARGVRLGALFSTQVFFTVLFGGKAYNPASINAHFVPQNGNVVPGQGGNLRFAPDLIARNLANGIRTFIANGVAYFTRCDDPFLINVDFNGNGTKIGLAATGIGNSDYWNLVAGADFISTFVYALCPDEPSAEVFNMNPALPLYDYANQLSAVRLVRRVQGVFSGTTASFDAMLGTWVGGYVGATPHENTFDIRDLPAGTYDLYLYANDQSGADTSTFTVAINGGSPTVKVNTTTGAAAFIEDSNYVIFQVSVNAGDYVTVQTEGFLSGMQITRA